jgi:hypothetical protein
MQNEVRLCRYAVQAALLLAQGPRHTGRIRSSAIGCGRLAGTERGLRTLNCTDTLEALKISILLLGTLLCASHLDAQDVRLSLGAELGYFPGVYERQTMNDYLGTGKNFDVNMDYSTLDLRAVFDFTFGLVSLGYRTAASRLNDDRYGSSPISFSVHDIEIRAFAKYPVRFEFGAVSPMLGMEYTFCVDGQLQGVSFGSQTRMDYSDLSVLGGLGLEVPLSGRISVRSGLLAGCVITSERGSAFYTGFRYVSSVGWFWELDVGIGYAL